MNRSARTFILIVLALCAGACRQVDDIAPPNVIYGQDICAQCSMIISDERFASALVMQEGEGRYAKFAFDDLNCHFNFEQQSARDRSIVARYVHDHETIAWIEMKDAWFVRSDAIRTPMASGVAAFASRAAAESLLERHADSISLTADDLQSHFLSPSHDGKER